MYTDLPKLCSGTIIATSNNPFQPNFVDTRSCEFEGFDMDSMKHEFTTGYFDSRQEEVVTIDWTYGWFQYQSSNFTECNI